MESTRKLSCTDNLISRKKTTNFYSFDFHFVVVFVLLPIDDHNIFGRLDCGERSAAAVTHQERSRRLL
jgi:hypothetical protein